LEVKKERERERDREGKKRKESNAPLASFLALSTTSTSNLLDLLHLLNNQTKPSQGETRMLLTKIPHFRELMVCSFECPHCGHRNNEITFAGMFGEKGSIHTLKVAENDRASRDRQVVKSETASVKVPELDFEIPAGTQSGTITTVEGILTEAATAMRSQQELRKIEDPEGAAALETFLEKLDAAASGGTAFTLIVDDPAGNAGVESTGPGDRELSVTHYERSNEQAAAVGLLPDASKEQDAKRRTSVIFKALHQARPERDPPRRPPPRPRPARSGSGPPGPGSLGGRTSRESHEQVRCPRGSHGNAWPLRRVRGAHHH
jgi:ZPR1 zinc finger protein